MTEADGINTKGTIWALLTVCLALVVTKFVVTQACTASAQCIWPVHAVARDRFWVSGVAFGATPGNTKVASP